MENRKIKDSMFTRLLSEKKYALMAFQALHPDDTIINENDIEIITLENVLSIDYYNDFSMIVKNKSVIFIEAQSTWSINILLKLLIYYVTEIKIIIDQKQDNIHSRKALSLLKPEFYVVYTGKEIVPKEISLAEYFFNGQKVDCDVHAHVITHGNQESNDFFYQYKEFCNIINDFQKDYKYIGLKAVELAIEVCIERNIFKEYLLRNKGAVINMLDLLFDQERITRVTKLEQERKKQQEIAEARVEAHAEGRAEGKVEGRAEGILESQKAIAINMLRNGYSIQEIIKCTELTQEQIENL